LAGVETSRLIGVVRLALAVVGVLKEPGIALIVDGTRDTIGLKSAGRSDVILRITSQTTGQASATAVTSAPPP
jgi:hypothetical protein